MLKRILASISILSLLLAVTVLVYWWRSTHGHVDHLHLGPQSSTQVDFDTPGGRLWINIIEPHTATSTTQGSSAPIITGMARPHQFREPLGYCLIVPCLWLAIKVRSMLPRPPGRNAEFRLQNAKGRKKA